MRVLRNVENLHHVFICRTGDLGKFWLGDRRSNLSL